MNHAHCCYQPLLHEVYLRFLPRRPANNSEEQVPTLMVNKPWDGFIRRVEGRAATDGQLPAVQRAGRGGAVGAGRNGALRTDWTGHRRSPPLPIHHDRLCKSAAISPINTSTRLTRPYDLSVRQSLALGTGHWAGAGLHCCSVGWSDRTAANTRWPECMSSL